MLLEVIVTNSEEALLAEAYGADRLELIKSFELGGLSPALEVSREVCQAVKIPVNVMIRPHGRNFVYDIHDITQIMLELKFLQNNTQANAVVFGALDASGNINHKLLQAIIENKGRLGLTFHRAIDAAANPLKAFAELLEYPQINQVLTSGGKNTALEGATILKQMVGLNNGRGYCQVLAGSGITPNNVANIIQKSGVTQIHIGSGVRKLNQLSLTEFEKIKASLKKEAFIN